jgi:hypothetical protein
VGDEQQQPQPGWLPPAQAPPQPQAPQAPPYQQPYQQYGHPPQGGYPPPQGYGPPWQPTYFYSYQEPGNGHAVTGFVLSLVSLGLLVTSFGFFAPLTLIMSVITIFVSRTGVQKVDRNETRKHRALGQWGFWLGIAGAVLSALAILAWTLVIVNDPDFFDEEYDRYDEPASLIA